jgi:hypothetical protein
MRLPGAHKKLRGENMTTFEGMDNNAVSAVRLLDRERIIATAGFNRWQSAAQDLGGMQVLYVGGRTHQVAQLKALVERARGAWLYYGGGVEHSTTLLPGLTSRADCTVFPVDCVSHDYGNFEAPVPAVCEAFHPAARLGDRR